MSAARPQGRAAPKSLRCAVYTRKSTEQGLEQEFNSLDNQREAAEAFIKSQAHEGWRLLPACYDDGGISGATLDRPALQRLLGEVRAGRIDIIVVYKVDRLTRSLTDFAKLVELFDQHGTSFVSVTQAFNTTSSMGRLTLNVLLSFAQFEREVTGERIRDKIAASKRRGLWLGGLCPLGYQIENKRLIPCPTEAEQVRFMFRRYLEVGSIKALLRDLDSRNMRTRAQQRRDGSQRGGLGFNPTGLCHLLKNRCYVGEVVHKGRFYPGAHEPIVDLALFEAVGRALAAKAPQQHALRANRESLLKGRLFDAKDDRMTPASCRHRGPVYRYYISRAAIVGRRADAPKRYRVSAPAIEAKVLEALGWEPAGTIGVSGDTSPSTPASLRERILAEVERVTVLPDTIRIELKGSEDDDPPAPITVPWASKGRYTKPVIIDPATGERLSAPIGQQQRARLLQGIANGRRWLDELAGSEVADIESLATRENCSPRYIRIVLNLAFLQPDTVRAAIAGTLPIGSGLVSLSERAMIWEQGRPDPKPSRQGTAAASAMGAWC